MKRMLILVVIALAVLAGAPFAAIPLSWVNGTYTVAMTDPVTGPRELTIGPATPVPDWMPRMPDSWLVQASRWAPGPTIIDEGDLDLISFARADRIEAFYRAELEQRGFRIDEKAQAPLNPATAALMGIDGGFVVHKPEASQELRILIRAPEGVILRPRLIQCHWRQLVGIPAPRSPAAGPHR